jgi:hypothetical protein
MPVSLEANMNIKPVKTPPASKEATPKVERDHPLKEDLTKNAPGPRREGPDNLRRRAEWFRRRTGGAKE